MPDDEGQIESKAWKRRKLLIALPIAAIAAAAAIFLSFYLTRPSVSVLSSALPDGFDVFGPSRLTSSFRLTGNASKADLAIVMPSVPVPSDAEGRVVLFGRAAEEGESPDLVLIPDPPLMWESALSEGSECILYESSDRIASDIAERLIEADGNAFEVTYSGRVSVANEEEIARKTADADTVLYLTPASSLRTMRTSSIPAVVDFIHGAALETTAVSGTVGIDWDRTIEGLLSGSDALSYAFFSSKD